MRRNRPPPQPTSSTNRWLSALPEKPRQIERGRAGPDGDSLRSGDPRHRSAENTSTSADNIARDPQEQAVAINASIRIPGTRRWRRADRWFHKGDRTLEKGHVLLVAGKSD